MSKRVNVLHANGHSYDVDIPDDTVDELIRTHERHPTVTIHALELLWAHGYLSAMCDCANVLNQFASADIPCQLDFFRQLMPTVPFDLKNVV